MQRKYGLNVRTNGCAICADIMTTSLVLLPFQRIKNSEATFYSLKFIGDMADKFGGSWF